jgi:hypothetical protein
LGRVSRFYRMRQKPNVAGERRPTRDDAEETKKSLPGGPSAPVAGSAMPYPYGD